MRGQCLQDQTLSCVLIHAELQAGARADDDAADPAAASATLQLRLPADTIAGFGTGLTKALPGKPAEAASVLSRITSAQDLAVPAAEASTLHLGRKRTSSF